MRIRDLFDKYIFFPPFQAALIFVAGLLLMLIGWLLGRDASQREALRRLVARCVAALDPCVRWELDGL